MTERADQIESVRRSYVQHASQFWELLKTKGAVRANRETDALDELIKDWGVQGSVYDLLFPLLAHDDEAVRYAAAAADLLSHGAPVEAIGVLQELAKNPTGFIAPTARLLLMRKKIPLTP